MDLDQLHKVDAARTSRSSSVPAVKRSDGERSTSEAIALLDELGPSGLVSRPGSGTYSGDGQVPTVAQINMPPPQNPPEDVRAVQASVAMESLGEDVLLVPSSR